MRISGPALEDCFYPETPEVLEATGDNANGLVLIGAPRLSGGGEYELFYQRYVERFQRKPEVEFILRTAYDALTALADGVEAVGQSPEALKTYLYAYRAQGALGQISFDGNGDIVGVNYELRMVKNKTSAPF